MRCPSCHRRLAPDSACPLHGGQLGESGGAEEESPPETPGFEIISALGHGGFARVYRARRMGGGTEVALKVARAPVLERFAREADALKRIGPPTTPALLGVGRTDSGLPFLAMERIRGRSLATWLESLPGAGIPALDEALTRFSNTCAAVEHMHAAGVIHRDLKPENIFLRDNGGIALLDFGLARFAGDAAAETEPHDELTRTGQRLGTPHYMAPEQCLQSRDAGAPADVYSLGIILFELLTGRPPFVGDAAEIIQSHVARRPPRPSLFAPVVPALEEVVLRCLAKDPSTRFAGARDLQGAVDRAISQQSGLDHARVPTGAPNAISRLVALLAVEASEPLPQLLEAVASEGAQLVRIHSGRCIFSFHQKRSIESGLRAATRAARRLEAILSDGGLAVVHAGEIRFRARASGPVPIGTCLDQSQRWWPTGNQRGLIVTPEAAALLERETHASLELPPAAIRRTPALRGRDEVLAALRGDAQDTWDQKTPTLTTLLGDVGLGKTRVLDAICAELSSKARVLRIVSAAPSLDRPQTALRSLLREALEIPASGASLEQLQLRCGERLAAPFANTAFVAAALSLEMLPEEDPRAIRLLSVPGAARHSAAKAAAEAIRALAKEKPIAVVLDDAHWADPTSLDALEMATLSGEPLPLWICAAALPSLIALRPFWGDRAGKQLRRTLLPLDAAASRAVLKELLEPVEFIPEPLLANLVETARGVPLSMVELVAAVQREGGIRQNPGTKAWYLAGDELLQPSNIPLYQRLADRALTSLTPQLCSLAQLCAAVGDEFAAEEVDAAQQLLETAETADPAIDASVGLDRLTRAALLKRVSEDRWAFSHPLVRQSVQSLTPLDRRERLHAVLLELALREIDRPSALSRVARHAAASGAYDRAFDAHLTIADEARRRHRYAEADQHYSAALAQRGSEEHDRRIAALAGRGKVRYRGQRFHDALDDLRAARSLAEHRASSAEILDLLLEEATVLDWLEDWSGSSALVEAARPQMNDVRDTRLAIRFDLAQGRMHRRREEWESALRILEPLIDRAAEVGDHETRAIGLLLVAGILIVRDSLEDAERRFEQLISLCSRSGDDLHLGAAYCVRVFLWLKRGLMSRAFEDLREAVARARELGNAQLERFASFNLAQCLHWIGEDEQALGLALRAHELGQRFFTTNPTSMDALLLARTLASKGDLLAARQHLQWVRAHCPLETLASDELMLFRLSELLTLDPYPPTSTEGFEQSMRAWTELVDQARQRCALEDNFMEILSTAADMALKRGRSAEAEHWLEELKQRLPRSPLWQGPYKTLSASLAAVTTIS